MVWYPEFKLGAFELLEASDRTILKHFQFASFSKKAFHPSQTPL